MARVPTGRPNTGSTPRKSDRYWLPLEPTYGRATRNSSSRALPHRHSVSGLAAGLAEQVALNLEVLRLRFEIDPLVADDRHEGFGEALLLLP